MPPLSALRTASLLLALACAACRSGGFAADADSAAPRAANRAVSAAAFHRNPAVSLVGLSPAGRRIAGLASNQGTQVIFETSRGRDEVNFLSKVERGTRVHTLGWSGDRIVVIGFDRANRELGRDRERESQMRAVRVDTWRPRPLGDSWPVRAHPLRPEAVICWPQFDPDHVLLNWWEPGDVGASVRRARVRDGLSSTVVSAHPGVDVWHADHRGRVRAGSGRSPDGLGAIVLGRIRDDAPFEELEDAGAAQQADVEFAGFAAEPGTLYLRAAGQSGRKALYVYDLEQRRRSGPLYEHPRFDVGELRHSAVDGALSAVEVDGERPALHFFDERAAREQAAIDAALPGTTNRIISQGRDAEVAIVRVSGDTTPPDYYHYDRPRKRMVFLFTAYPEVDRARLAPMEPVSYPARDGLMIPGYLTVPRGALPQVSRSEPQASEDQQEGAQRGEAERRSDGWASEDQQLGLPVIVLVHDGPSERDRWGWDPTVQFLASRGFAVFQPNFRGSSGYGREHERLGYREWGGAMQHDLADGVRWLVDQRIADARRVGIYGVGYGGYAALMGVVETPELFRAAASFGGVTDLLALLENGAHYRSADHNQPVEGALPRDHAALEALSPARQAARIRAPVLIGHGLADPIVHVDQARAMVSALSDAGRAVESHLYRGELHELLDERNRIDFHEKLAAFFERHLAVVEAL